MSDATERSLARITNTWANTPARLRAVILTAGTALIFLFVVPAIWPHSAPRGQIMLGAELGAINGLLALGLVLTYRASRVINFSYGAMGALAATIAVELNLAHHVNWFICIFVALLVGAGLGLFVDFIIRWRFFTAPRLIVMVVTIGLAQLFGGIQILVPGWLKGPSIIGGVTTPLSSAHVLVFPVLFNGNDLLIAIAVPVVLIALGWFLLRTDAGIAVRSVADNSDRARLLGIPVRRLSTLVWVIAGLIAALTTMLSAPSQGITVAAGAGPAIILPALAAAIIASMENLPLAFGAGVALGVTSGLFEFNMPQYGSAVGDVVNLVAILFGLLFLQRKRSRADDAEETFSATGILKPIPKVLRSLPEVGLAASASWRSSAVVVVIVPLVAGPGTTLEYTAALIYGIIALSLVVLTGWSGNVSLGQFAFAGVGGVLAGDLIEKANVDLFFCLAAAGAAGAVLAVIVGIPALRIRGAYLAAVTLALGVAMDTFFLNPTYFPKYIPQAFLRPVLWQRFDLESNKAFYFLCLGFLVLTILFIQGLRRARPGRVLLATRRQREGGGRHVGAAGAHQAGRLRAGGRHRRGGRRALRRAARGGGLRHLRPVLRPGGVLHGGHRRLGSISGTLMGVAVIEVAELHLPQVPVGADGHGAAPDPAVPARRLGRGRAEPPGPAAQAGGGPARHLRAEPVGRQTGGAGRPPAGGELAARARAERGRETTRRRDTAGSPRAVLVPLPDKRDEDTAPVPVVGDGRRRRGRRAYARATPSSSPARRSRSPTGRCRSSSGWTSTCTRARSWPCWAPTAPASRPCSRAPAAWSRWAAGPFGWAGRPSAASRPRPSPAWGSR